MSDSDSVPLSPFPELLPSNTQGAILPSTIPTPSYGPGGSFTVACSTTISASPAICLAALLKPSTWPQWNTFCPRATITDPPSSPPALPKSLADLEAPVAAKEFLVPGTQVTFDVHMNLDDKLTNRQPINVTRLEHLVDFDLGAGSAGGRRKGLRVAWGAGGFPGFLLRSERVQEFVEVEREDGSAVCEYFCWETFYGLLAPVVRLSVGGKLVVAFGAWMDGFKKFVEQGGGEIAAEYLPLEGE